MSRWSIALSIPAVFFLLGCGGSGDGPARVIVAGNVTQGGQPLPKGRITFYPVKGTNAPTSGAVIKNGQYRVDSHGGVPVGRHRVEFHVLEERQPKPGRPQIAIEENILPEKFNTKSKLEVTFEGTKAITLDFDLDKEFGDPKAK